MPACGRSKRKPQKSKPAPAPTGMAITRIDIKEASFGADIGSVDELSLNNKVHAGQGRRGQATHSCGVLLNGTIVDPTACAMATFFL